MIEKFPQFRQNNEGFEYEVAVTPEMIRDKLNEVIEAVNRMQSAQISANQVAPVFQDASLTICPRCGTHYNRLTTHYCGTGASLSNL